MATFKKITVKKSAKAPVKLGLSKENNTLAVRGGGELGPPREPGSGRFVPVPVPRNAAAAAAIEDARDMNRLLKFADVVEEIEDVGIIERLRQKLLFQGNPKISVRVKYTPTAAAAGVKTTIQRRLGGDDFGEPLRAIAAPKIVSPTKKSGDSTKLLR